MLLLLCFLWTLCPPSSVAMSTSSTYYINAAHFNHMVYQGSAVIGDYLYLDGGEVIVNTGTNATVFPYGIDWHVCTCLLYTSPSPRDGLLSRMPSSA